MFAGKKSKSKLVSKNAVRLSMGVARSGLWAPGPNNDGRLFNTTRLKKIRPVCSLQSCSTNLGRICWGTTSASSRGRTET